MAFNLPPFWSAGYRLPANVRVEDLQRGTFATRQQPRGSYDAPWVSAQGYAVPGYVMETTYGQGAMVTKQMPRGTAPYVAHWLQTPRAKIVAATKASGDGTEYHITGGSVTNPFSAYGKAVADHVVTTIKKLPAPKRSNALKQLFDRIDPRLWGRVNATATKAAKAGVPPQRALHHAIATEFHAGMVRELAQIGATKKIKTASQVGLGCFGCAAIGLGDTAVPGHWERPRATTPKDQVNACGYIWVGSGAPVPPTSPGGCPPVRVHASGDAGRTDLPSGDRITSLPFCGSKDASGKAITPCNPNVPVGWGKAITLGPFSFAGDASTDYRYRYTDPSKVPAAITAYLNQQADAHLNGPVFTTQIGKDRATATPTASAALPYDDNPTHYWLGFGGNYQLDPDYYSTDETKFPMQPLVQMQHPYVDKTYGLFLFMRGKDAHADGNGEDPPFMGVRWAPMDAATKGLWGNIKDTISGAGSDVGTWVQGAAGVIGNAACGLLQQPGAAAAAAATGPLTAIGAGIAASLCNPPAPGAGGQQQPPTVNQTGSNMITFLILGGAGLAAYLITRK
jgi:hypothetical protein